MNSTRIYTGNAIRYAALYSRYTPIVLSVLVRPPKRIAGSSESRSLASSAVLLLNPYHTRRSRYRRGNRHDDLQAGKAIRFGQQA